MSILAKYNKANELEYTKTYKWKCIYDRNFNILIFSPQK